MQIYHESQNSTELDAEMNKGYKYILQLNNGLYLDVFSFL